MSAWAFFKNYLFSKRSGALVKIISWLSVVSIAIGVTAFIVVLSVMAGLNKSIHKRMLAFEPHLVVSVDGVKSAQNLKLHPVFARLQELPELKSYLFEEQDVILRTGRGYFRGARAQGIDQKNLDRLFESLSRQTGPNEKLVATEFPEPGEIIVGVDLAQALDIFEGDLVSLIPPESLLLPPGEVPRIEKVRVKRILRTDLADVDGQMIYYNSEQGLKILQSSASLKSGIQVYSPDAFNLDKLKKNLESFPLTRVETWQERNSALFLSLRLEKITMGTFLGLAALIASFSILTVLTLLISQKKRDIAIMSAIGYSNARLRKTFILIGLWLSAFGMGGGLIIGTAISLYLELFPLKLLPDIYYDPTVPAEVKPGFIFLVIVIGAALALLSSFLPTKNISIKDPMFRL